MLIVSFGPPIFMVLFYDPFPRFITVDVYPIFNSCPSICYTFNIPVIVLSPVLVTYLLSNSGIVNYTISSILSLICCKLILISSYIYVAMSLISYVSNIISY